jgi:hypothetical protein
VREWTGVGYGLDQSGSGQEVVAGSCECGDEPSGCIKCGEFLSTLGRVSFSERTLLHGVSSVQVICKGQKR